MTVTENIIEGTSDTPNFSTGDISTDAGSRNKHILHPNKFKISDDYLDSEGYDRRKVFEQLERLLNAYYDVPTSLLIEYPDIPEEVLAKYKDASFDPTDPNANLPSENEELASYWKFDEHTKDANGNKIPTKFDIEWNGTKELIRTDPRARAIIIKALGSSPQFKRAISRYKGMDFSEDDKLSEIFNDEMNNKDYSFSWEDATDYPLEDADDSDALTTDEKRLIAEDLQKQDNALKAEIEANTRKALRDALPKEENDTQKNVLSALKDKRY